jgi:uncharacterized protein YjdB
VVTAKAAGQADITVTTEDGSKTAVCHVTVPYVAVTGINLEPSVTLSVDSTVRLKAAVSPANATNKAVSWESGNTKITAVTDDGVVTAKAAGTADIIVTTADGKKIDTCTVTVPVTGVNLEPSITLSVNLTVRLKANAINLRKK